MNCLLPWDLCDLRYEGLSRNRFSSFTCPAVIVREYPCVPRACVSNANNHDSPSQLYGKLIPLDAVSADEERKANTVWYHLCGHVAGWRRDEEKGRRRARRGEEVVPSSFDEERTFPTDTQDLPFCCWFRGNESRRLCRPHPHFETWRSQNLKHGKRERSRLIIGNERCLVMRVVWSGIWIRCN